MAMNQETIIGDDIPIPGGDGSNDEIFTPDEIQELNKLTKLRAKLITKLVGDVDGIVEVPGSTSEKVLLAQLIDGSERQTLTKARLRIAQKGNAASNDMRALVAAALKSVTVSTSRPAEPAARVLPDEYRPTDIVPGEVDQGLIAVTMNELHKQC